MRYYETIGVIAPAGRAETSGHRVYGDEDLDLLTGVTCLSATGMSVSDVKRYVANGLLGPVQTRDASAWSGRSLTAAWLGPRSCLRGAVAVL